MGTRFVHYINEFQKYLKYIFTGHIAIGSVFVIGAGGYTYSEWLKEVSPDFPRGSCCNYYRGCVDFFRISNTIKAR